MSKRNCSTVLVAIRDSQKATLIHWHSRGNQKNETMLIYMYIYIRIYCIHWDAPPPSTSGKYKFIEIPKPKHIFWTRWRAIASKPLAEVYAFATVGTIGTFRENRTAPSSSSFGWMFLPFWKKKQLIKLQLVEYDEKKSGRICLLNDVVLNMIPRQSMIPRMIHFWGQFLRRKR